MARALLLLVFLLALARVSLAQCPGVTTQLTPFAKEKLTVSATAIPLTASIYKPSGVTPVLATLSVEGGTIRYQVVGSPTVDDGHPLVSGAVLSICGLESIAAFKAIRIASDAILNVVYYKLK